jgi:hypothetical protein
MQSAGKLAAFAVNEERPMSTASSVRNENAVILFRWFVDERMAFGEQGKGMDQAFSALVEVSPQTWSVMKKGSLRIGDEIARRIECRTGKPEGWLDGDHRDDGESWSRADEREVAQLALAAFRRSDASGRVLLAKLIEDFRAD